MAHRKRCKHCNEKLVTISGKIIRLAHRVNPELVGPGCKPGYEHEPRPM